MKIGLYQDNVLIIHAQMTLILNYNAKTHVNKESIPQLTTVVLLKDMLPQVESNY